MNLLERIYTAKNKCYAFICNMYLDMRGRGYKERNFSIICNNCMAGFIYHRLHMQFSPTINLWIGDTVEDYIRMLLNLSDYFNKDLVFIHDGVRKYPRAWLGDVKIGFNHYKDEEEAREAWNKRLKRVLWDELYVIVYARDGISEADYQKLLSCGFKKVAVVGDKKAAGFITDGLKFRNEKESWESKVKGVRIFERDFDYFSFLK